ncbi:hypothetical protein DMB66_01605 [Actinoplanes sp. ATCC 53533]|uniref:hypothetical protein n=1 Tax=Actinoplanes sp. ATCC 53533 TaxID=1288362 RepID=UPI000F778579|nr:hypothetical protein [Actinoplanes sp. ATCC 53533]RSM74145.1 hypothetical protein DMB66_01605 [Actinoplanes sp. ATCC 53533]
MTDDDLRARLRNADPATGLAPLPPERVTRLLEDSMTNDLAPSTAVTADPAEPFSPGPVSSREAERPVSSGEAERPVSPGEAERRPARAFRRLAFAAAGLVVGVAAVAVGAALRSSDEPGPAVRPAILTVARIVVAGGGAAKCVPPSAATLSAAPLAFAGTVERVAGGTAVLTVTHQYAGTRADVVEVAQSDGNSEALIGATAFEPGRAYLVAATDGRAMVCGYSGLATPELQALYDAAF